MRQLASACDPATFRINDRDVLDLLYWTAGEMDGTDSMTGIDPERAGVVDAVRYDLLHGKKCSQPIYVTETLSLCNVLFCRPGVTVVLQIAQGHARKRRYVRLTRRHLPGPSRGRRTRPRSRGKGDYIRLRCGAKGREEGT